MIWDTVYKYFKMWLWIFIGLNLVTEVHGYASGYFPNSCRHMIVDHKDRNNVPYEPQKTEEPFEVRFSPSVTGDLIKVTLIGAEFRGFMLEAWTNGTDHPVGNFELLEPKKTRLLTCTDVKGYAVSHKGNHLKTSVEVNWMADEPSNTNITFRVRVVESTAIFWNFEREFIMPSTTPNPTMPSTTIDTTMESTTMDTTMASTTTDTTMASTTTDTTMASTTMDTTMPSTTTYTTMPSTTTYTTMASTTTDTTMASTTTDTTMASTTTDTTMASTTMDTTMPSTTTDTTMASTTTDTTMASTTTDTTMASTAMDTTMPGTTIDTVMPSTTIDTAMPSTTINTTVSSSTTEPDSNAAGTAGPSTTTQGPKPFSLLEGAGTAMMNFGIVVVLVKMELPNILMATLVNSLCSRHLNKALKILSCLLCAAIEISALVLFCLAEPIKVTLIALVCVTIVINFVELVIVCLPIGPSHELKEISNLIAEVCSVIHGIFTIAVIFVGVLDNDNCGKSKKDSWLVKVMIAFTVWTVLFVIWVFVRRLFRKTILGGNKTGSLKNNEIWRQQRKKKKTSAVAVIFPAVSVLFIFGTTCFAVAVTDGIFQCQTK